MTPLEELTQLASEKGRRIFVAQSPIDLRTKEGRNCIYVLQLPESSPGAGGGRIGRIGGRRIRKTSVSVSRMGRGLKAMKLTVRRSSNNSNYPTHAAGLTITLPDGSERVVTGVVDKEFIQRCSETL